MDEIEKLVEKYEKKLGHCCGDVINMYDDDLRSALREAQRMAYEDAAKHCAFEAQHHQGSAGPFDCGAFKAYKNESRWLQALADSMKGE